MDGRGAFGAQGRHRRLRQRVAAGGRRAQIPLARGDRRLGGLRPAAQLHAGDSLAVRLQRLLRDERSRYDQGRNHHRRRGPIHGVEDRGRQAGGRALRQFRRPLPRDVREEPLHRAARRLHLLLGEGREGGQDIERLPSVLRRAQGRRFDAPRRRDGRSRRCLLAHAGKRQVAVDGLLRQAVTAGDGLADDCRADRPQRPRRAALRPVCAVQRLSAAGACAGVEPRPSA